MKINLIKKANLSRHAIIAACCSLGTLPLVHAAASPDALVPIKATGSDALVDSSDKSGTNPVAFTFDARVYNEYQWLNVPGDGSQNITTFEFRAPFADGKWQFRTRLRATNLDVDSAGISEFGFGDMDMRFLTVPYLNMQKKQAFAFGLELFIPTGSNDALSTNAFTLGPQAFYVFFAPFNGLVDLIAPGYQHQFSVYEESGANDVHLGLVDLFILKTFNDKQQWFLINPQAIIDFENQKEWGQLDMEIGTMLKTQGHSIYARPSVGIGSDRLYDYSLEMGYKIIW